MLTCLAVSPGEGLEIRENSHIGSFVESPYDCLGVSWVQMWPNLSGIYEAAEEAGLVLSRSRRQLQKSQKLLQPHVCVLPAFGSPLLLSTGY